jgi:hypothetical protein
MNMQDVFITYESISKYTLGEFEEKQGMFIEAEIKRYTNLLLLKKAKRFKQKRNSFVTSIKLFQVWYQQFITIKVDVNNKALPNYC